MHYGKDIKEPFEEVKRENPPSMSITMRSLLHLNSPDKGWKIETNCPKIQEIFQKKMAILAVLGMYDVGKSWLCNVFSGTTKNDSGHSNSTHSLDFVFPEDDNSLIAIIDTPGSHKAIPIMGSDLVEMIQKIDKPSNYFSGDHQIPI